MKPYFLFICAGAALASCASEPSAISIPAPDAVAVPACISLTPWTDIEQDQMRKEYDALAPSAIMREVFMDYVGLRDEIRAGDLVCPAAATPAPSANTLY